LDAGNLMSEEQRLAVNEMLIADRMAGPRTLEEVRAVYDAKGQLCPVPAALHFERRRIAGVELEFGIDPDIDCDRTILFAHGGGGVVGSFESHRGMLARLGQSAHANTIAVGYRLAPEHKFPAALDDVLAAYRWLVGTGAAPEDIAVAADSAGASLVLAALMQARDEGMAMPAACALFSPMVDQTGSAASMVEKAGEDLVVTRQGRLASSSHYIGDTARWEPRLSPLFGNLAGLPPLLIQVGTAEALLDDAVSLSRRAMLANVEVRLEGWSRMQHVWHMYASVLDEAGDALDAAGAFIAARLSAPERTGSQGASALGQAAAPTTSAIRSWK
jgi:acetyl esterase/lipase